LRRCARRAARKAKPIPVTAIVTELGSGTVKKVSFAVDMNMTFAASGVPALTGLLPSESAVVPPLIDPTDVYPGTLLKKSGVGAADPNGRLLLVLKIEISRLAGGALTKNAEFSDVVCALKTVPPAPWTVLTPETGANGSRFTTGSDPFTEKLPLKFARIAPV
jgi:hypothetical protein